VVRAGVEHELRVWAGAEQVDFRQALPLVAGGLRALDPGDPRARRLPSGVVLTADGREAELATPPVPWAGDAPTRLDALLAAERAELAVRVAAACGADRLTGFSTHVNVSVPDDRVVDVGRRFARSCALATAVVAEPASSSGLLVRPRRGRLEVGGEYAEGEDLVALLTFVGSAVSALVAGSPPPDLPDPVVEPAREKFGWYLPPDGPYADLLTGELHGAGLLGTAWEWARPWCVRDGIDPAPVDRLVAGAPLRLAQHHRDAGACTVSSPSDVPRPPTTSTGPRRLADGTEAEALWVTWSHVVWRFARGGRTAYAVLPVDDEEDFLVRLDGGGLDADIRQELGRRLGRRRLLVHADLDGRVWWHAVRPGALVPAERTRDGLVPRVSRLRAGRQLRRDPDVGT
jgi:hypothetical protein